MELLVGNPVHVYTLLDRLVRGLPGLLAGVSSQLGDSINLVTGHLAQLGLGDVEAAGQALVRIQFAYRCPVSAPPAPSAPLAGCRLDPADLARGLICGVQTRARLTSRQMVDIARSRCGPGQGRCGL